MKLQCGPMPNVMVALPNTGGALCSTTRVPCSNAAKTHKLLKFAGLPQTRQQISAISGLKFTILWGHVGRYSRLTSYFRLSIHALVQLRRYSPTKSCDDSLMANFWWCFASYISVSRMQHVSDLHPKFVLRPHHVCKYDRHPICNGWD